VQSTAASHSLYVEGVSLWSPRLPGWESARAILRGDAPPPEKPLPRPAPALLPPTERRRAPDTVAIALEVAARACEGAGRDPKLLPSVFASTHGDLAINDYMCDTLAKTPTLTSPTRFHNSVHNAAAGYWTIATGCLAPYTALTAYPHAFGEGLLESATQSALDASPVLFVAYDIEARGPLATMARSKSLLGSALVLAPERTEGSVAELRWRVREAPGAESTRARPENAALVEGNAMASCLAVFEALADQVTRDLVQTLSAHLVMDLTVEPLR
jgi:hypothetical protein